MVGVMNVSAQEIETVTVDETTGGITGNGILNNYYTWISNNVFDERFYLTVVDNDAEIAYPMNFENSKLHIEVANGGLGTKNTHKVDVKAPLGWVIKGVYFKVSVSERNYSITNPLGAGTVTVDGVSYDNKKNEYTNQNVNAPIFSFNVNQTSGKSAGRAKVTFTEFEVYLKRADANPSDERLNEVTGVYAGVRYWEWVQENPVKKGDFYKIVNYTSYDSKIQAAGQDTKQIVNDIEEAGEWYLAEDGSITTIYGDVRQSRPIYDGILSSDATGWDVTPKGSGANLLGYQIHATPVLNTYYIIADENQMKDPHVGKLGDNDEEGDPDVPNKYYSIWNFYTLEQYDCYVDYKNAYETFMALNDEFGSGKEEEDDEYVALREEVLRFVAHGNTEDSRYEAYEWINKMLDLVAVLKGSTGDGKLENPGAEELKKYWRFRRTKTKEESWSSATTDNKRSGSRMFDLRNCTMSQDIKNLKTGVYKLTVWWQARGEMDGDPASTIVLKASGSADSQEIKLVGTNTTGENNWKQDSLYVTVVDGRLTVSASVDTYRQGHGWANLDDFELVRLYKNKIIDDEENMATLYKGVFDGRDDEGQEYPEETIAEVTVNRPYADVTAAYFRSMKFDRSANPNGLCYAAAGKKVTGLDGDADAKNVVKGKVCASLELVDKYPFCTKDGFTADNVSYTMKSFGQGNDGTHDKVTYGTLMLPYIPNLTLSNGDDDNVKIYTIVYDATNKAIKTKRVTSIGDMKANTPYFVEIKNSIFENEEWSGISLPASSQQIAANIKNSYVTDASDANCLVGLYDKKSVPNNDGNYALQVQGGKIAFYRVVTDNVTGNTFRCYLHLGKNDPYMETQSSEALRFVFSDEDDVTGINEVEIVNGNGAIYDLSGRRVETISRPGIYVQNGKKVLVK